MHNRYISSKGNQCMAECRWSLHIQCRGIRGLYLLGKRGRKIENKSLALF